MLSRAIRVRGGCVRVSVVAAVCTGAAMAEPLTKPSQLTPGNQLITFEGRAVAPIGVAPKIQCVTFSSPQGMSIVDLTSQPYSGPLVGGRAIHPLPGAIGSGVYINTSIAFDPPVKEIGLGWWDPTAAGCVLRVYNSSVQFLEEITVPAQPPGGGGASFVGIRRPTAEIALAICFPGANNDTYAIDNVSYGPGCYVNCDCSTVSPSLTANDFQCFLNSFAANDAYANCDGSTVSPTLTANDFQCFLNKYASGCS